MIQVCHIGKAPFLISDDLYNSDGYTQKSITISSYSQENIQNAFMNMISEYSDITKQAINITMFPIVDGWDTVIRADSTWLTVLTAAYMSGLFANVTPIIPAGGISTSLPDGSSSILTGNIDASAADSALSVGGAHSLYSIHQTQTIDSHYYRLPQVELLVFPTSVLSNGVIDVTGITSKVKAFRLSATYRSNYKHVIMSAGVSQYSEQISTLTKLNGFSPSILPDPFNPNPIPGEPGGISGQQQGGDGTGGGWGDFDYSSDGPEDKDPPTITTYDAGFCTLYNATQSQIKALADYMWADTSDFINNWHKLWANPMDAILGISLVPLAGLLGGTSTLVKVGNIATTVTMTKLSSSMVKVECGTVHITSQSLSHSFMDFPPYNQVQLYLPYIGTVPISATDVIDKYLTVNYLCDALSGSCVAFVISNGYTVATYSGNIAAAVPVTSGDFANIVFAALDYLKVVGQDVASGVGGVMATQPHTVGKKTVQPTGLQMAGGIANAVSSGASLIEDTFEIGHSILVPQITKGGPAGSTAGYMNHQKPFLIFNAPNVAAPKNMNTYIGYAQYETMNLGSCSGYTKVADIHYKGRGTEAEREEIEALLRSGVDL